MIFLLNSHKSVKSLSVPVKRAPAKACALFHMPAHLTVATIYKERKGVKKQTKKT